MFSVKAYRNYEFVFLIKALDQISGLNLWKNIFEASNQTKIQNPFIWLISKAEDDQHSPAFDLWSSFIFYPYSIADSHTFSWLRGS